MSRALIKMGGHAAGTLLLLTLLAAVTSIHCVSAPDKPTLKRCRSPEKETFTCWWEPGYDGGLPTTYTLYYRLENSETVLECPDYETAGEHSCYFDKNHTSIWVNYNITVVATNQLGSSYSNPVDVDVVYIVQPHTPENVRVQVKEDEQEPYLRVSWEKPHNADTGSGWITLVYQLRLKLLNQNEWEEHVAGQQKSFNIYSLHSGGSYLVQVRCKPDHGLWSEWSEPTYAQVPEYIPKERSIWILMAVLFAVILIIFTCTVNVKGGSLKDYILPPVPGPKIKGFDTSMLKGGESDKVFNTLVIPGFPPPSDYEDLLIEYLEVYENGDSELILDGKDPQDGWRTSKSPLDNDSGRGSCDSHTLLVDKCGGMRDDTSLESPRQKSVITTVGSLFSTVSEFNTAARKDNPSGKWPMLKSHSQSVPDVFVSPPTSPLQEHTKPSDSNASSTLHQLSIKGVDGKGDSPGPTTRNMEYVEVQKVNQQNVLLLTPLAEHSLDSHNTTCPLDLADEDYSKVKGVTSDNVLLLQQRTANRSHADNQEREEQEEPCLHTQQVHYGKRGGSSAPVLPRGMQLTSGGYVDTTVIMPTC